MGEAFMSYHPDPIVREYEDRGMAKWMGFYLSEHTAEMEKDTSNRNTIWQIREAMAPEEIFTLLNEAFKNKKIVNIQLAELDEEGKAYRDRIGRIEGYQGNNLYLQDENGNLEMIPMDSISNVFIVETNKWSQIL